MELAPVVPVAEVEPFRHHLAVLPASLGHEVHAPADIDAPVELAAFLIVKSPVPVEYYKAKLQPLALEYRPGLVVLLEPVPEVIVVLPCVPILVSPPVMMCVFSPA